MATYSDLVGYGREGGGAVSPVILRFSGVLRLCGFVPAPARCLLRLPAA
jgi:hypothetical protein